MSRTAPEPESPWVIQAAGLRFDFARQPIAATVWKSACQDVRESGLVAARKALISAGPVNSTEKKAATHMAGRDIALSATQAAIMHTSRLAEQIRTSGCDTLVHVGIGGSELGIRLASEAFLAAGLPLKMQLRFLSGLDPAEWRLTLQGLDPARTVFVLASKSFTTQETLLLGERARAWLGSKAGERLFAVTANKTRAEAWGIASDRIAMIEDTIGGRFSLASSMNLSLRAAFGDAPVMSMLEGMHAMDGHFVRAAPERNAPVLAALARFLNRNRRGLTHHIVVPYAWGLRSLPAYLQQLIMESLGKGLKADAEPLTADPCSGVWGSLGSNAQHAYFQWLHQHPIGAAVDLIAIAPGKSDRHAELLFTHAVAQAQALATGFVPPDSRDPLAPHRRLPGGRPSNFIALPELSPHSLGALIAFYEASVFVEALLTGVNPFDQFGVEYGKTLADAISAAWRDPEHSSTLDATSRALLRWAHDPPAS